MIKNNKRPLKTFEAYRYSDMLEKEFSLGKVRANNSESAYKYFKNKFEKDFGDTRSFRVRELAKE